MKKYFIVFGIFCFYLGYSQGSGNVLSFNGINRYVNLATTVADGARTVEFWFKPNQTIDNTITDAISLIGRDYDNGSSVNLNEFGFWFNPGWGGGTGGSLNFTRRVNTSFYWVQSNSTTWIANTWYHVAGVIDPVSGMKLYINGVLQSYTDTSTQPIQAQTGSVFDMIAVGTWGYWGAFSGNRFFNGDIDEVRFWSSARSQTQIREKMCSKLFGNETGLMSYYKFDETSGLTLIDSGPAVKNGTLVNFGTNPWHYSSAPIGDISTYIYPSNFTGVNLTLNYATGDYFELSDITGNGLGAHIYRVNSLPNMQSGLSTNVFSYYYGCFLTGTTGSYKIAQDISYSSNCNSSCGNLFSRNDNASVSWTSSLASLNNCVFTKTNESTNGDSFREEYIFSTQSNVLSPIRDTVFCEGSFVVLDAGTGYSSYLWQNSINSQTLMVNQTGEYFVEVSGSCGIQKDTVFVQEILYPVISLPNETILCSEYTVQLNAFSNNASYAWSTGETAAEITVFSPGTYIVTVSQKGCSSIDSTEVVVKIVDKDFSFPNIITPNNDGINDFFSFEEFLINELSYKIYDRWGLLVFESNSKSERWFGTKKNKICDDGTYFWIAEYTMECHEDILTKKTGFITLIK